MLESSVSGLGRLRPNVVRMGREVGRGKAGRWRVPLAVVALLAVVGGVGGLLDGEGDAPGAAPSSHLPAGVTETASASASPGPAEPSSEPPQDGPTATSPTPSADPTLAAPDGPAAGSAGHDPAEPSDGAAPQERFAGQPGTALAAVAELEVKGRAPKTGYDRDAFAYRAYDQDRNGCDVRNDVLRRDLTDLVIGAGTNGCVVTSGTLVDPYSGATIAFTRGAATSNDVQIDHVVALSDAWQKGAQGLEADTLRELGNDPLNLLAVDGPLNAQKGDGDAATWLPPDKTARCDYVARQVAVKVEYDLWVTQAERDAMVRVLAPCPDEPLPVRETAPLMPELAR